MRESAESSFLVAILQRACQDANVLGQTNLINKPHYGASLAAATEITDANTVVLTMADFSDVTVNIYDKGL